MMSLPGPLLPLLTVGILLLGISGCSDSRLDTIPHADPAVDTIARSFLSDIVAHDLPALRRRLNDRGGDRATPETMARIFNHFPDRSAPLSIVLAEGEIADSHEPTPAVRHRLTYRLGMPEERRLWYFFELTVEGGDSVVTGFRVEE